MESNIAKLHLEQPFLVCCQSFMAQHLHGAQSSHIIHTREESMAREKNPRRLERCSMDEVVASFHGLQVSSVPFRPSGFCSGRQPRLQRRRGSLGSTRLQRSVKQLRSCKEGSEPCRARASRLGHQRAQKVEQLRAAGVVRADKAAVVGRGSAKLHTKVKVRVQWPPEYQAAGCRKCRLGSRGCRGRSYGRKSRVQSPKCRRLAKPKCRGRKKSQITHRKWRPEAMSRAREAQCRCRHSSRRKVNSLNPFLQAAVRVPLAPQLLLLPF
ncbi:Uncharacterized protein HZ326_26443 [Fusarium oxysporum f. sp. albedinis]|nr:Uncharacterized protein HZ326_26443 [Fusarium oxysporum f. sp. albedinis]